ncbi:ABC transporter substrate-binding protein [Bradyrhizobium ottawaense]|uniref:ABC transporter substrate-binding protein n=1 Tax=Bradyrhizobium ottawaense TaxID=931866 RepID=UPI002714E3D0|nr:ABC transporter substrate-binding protein [Bradyrhizobium ottawaense]WLB43036.1 ABC transporter substrate-binding protein [Bradyrhizobium ottawaense]
MADTSVVLSTLAAGGRPALKLATVICKLIVKVADREIDGLEKYQVVSFGQTVNGARFPDRWWPRLAKAIDTGAFDRMSVQAIVDVMVEYDRP